MIRIGSPTPKTLATMESATEPSSSIRHDQIDMSQIVSPKLPSCQECKKNQPHSASCKRYHRNLNAEIESLKLELQEEAKRRRILEDKLMRKEQKLKQCQVQVKVAESTRDSMEKECVKVMKTS